MEVRHPSLWMFIRQMKDEKRRERLQLRRERQGQNELPLKRKWRRLERRLKKSDESTVWVFDHFPSTGPRYHLC